MSNAGQPLVREETGGLDALTLTSDAHGVLTLTLRQPGRPVVVLDWALLKAIDAAMDRAEKTAGLAGFVLASDSRVFIAGANLQEIMDLTDAQLHDYLRFGQKVYGRIAKLPCTSVAAINGAALGGGLEIAMHCTHLIAAEPPVGTPEKPGNAYHIGLPESGLSICPGWGGTNLLPARMEPGYGIELTAAGRTLPVDQAKETGLIEELVPAAELANRAANIARRPKSGPRETPVCIAVEPRRSMTRSALARVASTLPNTQAARAVVACVEAGLTKGWEAALDAEREHLVQLRSSEEGQAAIRKFFEKTATK